MLLSILVHWIFSTDAFMATIIQRTGNTGFGSMLDIVGIFTTGTDHWRRLSM